MQKFVTSFIVSMMSSTLSNPTLEWMYLQGTETTPEGTPEREREILPASVPP